MSDRIADRSAGGALVDVGLPPGLPAVAATQFYWADPYGNLWSSAVGVDGILEDTVTDVATGAVSEFGHVLLAGRAVAPGAEGVVGERVLSQEGVVVWQARDEGGDLTYDSFDIFAMAPGRQPVKIGESTVDVDGRALSAPGDGNYLTVAASSAWWVDGELREDPTDPSGYRRYSSIYTAPLDGSSEQRVVAADARLVAIDRCSGDEPRVLYVTDAVSSGDAARVAEIRAHEPRESSTNASDAVVWSAPEAGLVVDSFAVCGDLVAVATARVEDGLGVDQLVSVRDGSGDLATIAVDAHSGGAGRLAATPAGAFFFEWNTGALVFWSRADGNAYAIGTAASFPFAVASDGTVVMPEASVDAASGLAVYSPRRVALGNP